jgi:hypothetical protein
LRKIIGLRDEQYNLTIARSNLFAPIVDAFKTNKRRYNLLNSALIELFEFIRQVKISLMNFSRTILCRILGRYQNFNQLFRGKLLFRFRSNIIC